MWQIYSPIDVGHQKKRLRLKKWLENYDFKRVAIGMDAEEGKHEFLKRRETKIIKIDDEVLNGKQGSLFFTATASSKTLCPLSVLHSSPHHFFHPAHRIASIGSSSSTTLWGKGLLFWLHPPSATLLHLQLPDLCLIHSRLSRKICWMNGVNLAKTLF